MAKKPTTTKPGPEGSGTPPTDVMEELLADLIEGCRADIEAGNGDALLYALLQVCMSDAPMPTWLRPKLAAAVRRYTHDQERTLDEAFGVVRPKGWHQKAAHERRKKGARVFHTICGMRAAGAALDEALFKAVGNLHGVGKTVAADWYYHHLERYVGLSPDGVPAVGPAPQKVIESLATSVNWLSPVSTNRASAKTGKFRKDS